MHPVNPVYLLLAVLFAVFCLFRGLTQFKRRRLIEDLPTCSTAGAFIGLIEIQGTAESTEPLQGYLSDAPCVHYSWTVEEKWERTRTYRHRDSQGRSSTRTKRESGWTTVASGGETLPFYLKDSEGVLLIRPEGARMETQRLFSKQCDRSDPLYYDKGPEEGIRNSVHQRRFSESGIPLHHPVYVVGKARERSDVVAAEIAQDPEAEMFLISTRSEKQITRRLALGAFFWHAAAMVVLGFLTFMLVGSFPTWPKSRKLLLWLIPTSYVLMGLLGWIWTVYNALIGLRHRVRQAWSQVEVELKRRADLIPRLVAALQGMKAHESDVQTLLADLRSQGQATAPGEMGPDPHGLHSRLIGLAEAYPELRADGSFSLLMQELANTENRIALARGYFNQIASFFNTRIEVWPDAFLARLAGCRARALLQAEDFERTQVEVNLES